MNGQSMPPSRLLTLALAGACGLLVVVLVLQRWLAGGAPETSAIQVAASGAGAPSALETRRFELPAESEYAEVTARPLFNEDRRPEERDQAEEDAATVAAEQAASEPPPVSLTGVIITPEERIAMLQNTKNREYVTLKQGEPLEGWTLEEVNHRRIVLSTGGRQQVVELEVYTGSLGGGRRVPGGNAGGRNGGEQPGQEQDDRPMSATEQIRERIQRERERRRQLIEEARKRQQNADSDQ